MSIVAISATLGSLGDEVGRELARSLSYQFANREIILKAAEEFGEGELELEHLTEERPTLWERFSESKQRYLTYVQAIIWGLAARDNAVLMGRGAAFVLRNVRQALRVRITAPEALRVKRVEQKEALTPHAADLVRRSDRERAARARFLYQVDWDAPLSYDLVLNTERLDVHGAAQIIRAALQQERFQPTPKSLAEVKDLSVTAHARAALLANPITRPLRLYITCESGYLSVRGVVRQDEERKIAEEILGMIPGVRRLVDEIVVARQSVHGASEES